MTISKDEIAQVEILLEAQKLFRQFGFKKTTMDEIAVASGKAKSTIYHYFRSKDEVFEAVFNLEMRNLRIIVKEKVDAERLLKNKVLAYFLNFYKEVLNKANVYRILKQDLINSQLTKYQFRQVINIERSYLSRILEDGYDTGEFDIVEKKDITWFAEITLTAFLGIARFYMETEEGIDQEKLEKVASILIPKMFT